MFIDFRMYIPYLGSKSGIVVRKDIFFKEAFFLLLLFDLEQDASTPCLCL